MKDYFALLTKPRNIQKLLKTEPSKPSKGAYEGNDGLVDKGFQNLVSPKTYISVSGDLVIPFDSDRTYRYWQGGQSIVETLAELNAPPQAWLKYAGTDDTHNRHCEGELKETGKGIVYCAACHRFTLTEAQDRYNFEERAAIVEFDGGLPRDKAEGIALAEVLQGEPGANGEECK